MLLCFTSLHFAWYHLVPCMRWYPFSHSGSCFQFTSGWRCSKSACKKWKILVQVSTVLEFLNIENFWFRFLLISYSDCELGLTFQHAVHFEVHIKVHLIEFREGLKPFRVTFSKWNIEQCCYCSFVYNSVLWLLQLRTVHFWNYLGNIPKSGKRLI